MILDVKILCILSDEKKCRSNFGITYNYEGKQSLRILSKVLEKIKFSKNTESLSSKKTRAPLNDRGLCFLFMSKSVASKLCRVENCTESLALWGP